MESCNFSSEVPSYPVDHSPVMCSNTNPHEAAHNCACKEWHVNPPVREGREKEGRGGRAGKGREREGRESREGEGEQGRRGREKEGRGNSRSKRNIEGHPIFLSAQFVMYM